ncbi:hypothetical protein TrST_g8077 [Triparma strigata]|uniref:AB hydrolase-1 domain-containing protein n=1 Tax=Triparma strigata TaxID=1606541 RepID=A0A9W6ZP30_9STRA|nr:hypothetical protein TrST_g8077 [Triparma strigata]
MTSTSEITYDKMSERVFDFLDWAGIDKCVVMGHSMGGKVGMVMATGDEQERLEGLIVIDIAPVTYSSSDGTDWSLIETIITTCSTLPLPTLTTKKSASDLLKSTIPDPSLRSFILTNLSQTSSSLKWKVPIKTLSHNLQNLSTFPKTYLPYPGDTYFITGSLSKYVRLKYLPQISARFPRHMIATIRGAGHWCHAESPADVVSLVGKYINR